MGIFCMTASHREHLLCVQPQAAAKVRLLMALVGRPDEGIPDPIGQPLDVYRDCLTSMQSPLEALVTEISASISKQTDIGDRSERAEDKSKNILFVCTGNTCRSPMAHYLLEDLVAKAGLAGQVSVASRGAAAETGVAENGVGALRELVAADVTQRHAAHQARQVTDKDVECADRIYCMTASHREHLLRVQPEAAPKVKLLMALVGRPNEGIPDPIGQPMKVYQACLASMRLPLEALVAELRAEM